MEGSSGMSKDGDNEQEEETKAPNLNRRMTKLENESVFQGALDKLNV